MHARDTPKRWPRETDLVEDEVNGRDVLLAEKQATLAAHLHEAEDVHVFGLAACAKASKLDKDLAQLAVGGGFLARGHQRLRGFV